MYIGQIHDSWQWWSLYSGSGEHTARLIGRHWLEPYRAVCPLASSHFHPLIYTYPPDPLLLPLSAPRTSPRLDLQPVQPLYWSLTSTPPTHEKSITWHVYDTILFVTEERCVSTAEFFYSSFPSQKSLSRSDNPKSSKSFQGPFPLWEVHPEANLEGRLIHCEVRTYEDRSKDMSNQSWVPGTVPRRPSVLKQRYQVRSWIPRLKR